MSETRIEILAAYLPPVCLETTIRLMVRWPFELKITRKRTSKVGDYRPPAKGQGHRISVNHDLNPYAFLLTLIHEMAHLVVWQSGSRKIPHHGGEWKAAYRELLEPFYADNLIPADIRKALDHFFERTGDANRSDSELNLALKHYNQPDGSLLVGELPPGSLFRVHNGKVFRKGDKIRKRFRCLCIDNRRQYLVHPLMEAYPIHYQYTFTFPEDN